MVIDTSALAAIIFGEPEREAFGAILVAESPLVLSAVSLYETAVVVASRKGNPAAAKLVDEICRDFSIEISAFDAEQSMAARGAYLLYGRGRHPAGLNLADCASYALAKTRDEPLLFKGDDFSQTDVIPAWRP
jgi:ribonuclease VapC